MRTEQRLLYFRFARETISCRFFVLFMVKPYNPSTNDDTYQQLAAKIEVATCKYL
jgi:hypothetical protein